MAILGSSANSLTALWCKNLSVWVFSPYITGPILSFTWSFNNCWVCSELLFHWKVHFLFTFRIQYRWTEALMLCRIHGWMNDCKPTRPEHFLHRASQLYMVLLLRSYVFTGKPQFSSAELSKHTSYARQCCAILEMQPSSTVAKLPVECWDEILRFLDTSL